MRQEICVIGWKRADSTRFKPVLIFQSTEVIAESNLNFM